MTPYAQALDLYKGDSTRFLDELKQHFAHGYVVATPDAFAMARPVCSDWDTAKFRDISQVAPFDEADTWFIWLLAGKLEVAVRWLPRPLPFLGYSRRGSLCRFVAWERLQRLVERHVCALNLDMCGKCFVCGKTSV